MKRKNEELHLDSKNNNWAQNIYLVQFIRDANSI